MVSFDYKFVPTQIYCEKRAQKYSQANELIAKFSNMGIPVTEIENHQKIEQLRAYNNSDFVKLKQYLVIGERQSLSHRKNNKTSDYLVPYTSSGCSAFCVYCYLVCHYYTSAYLRVFVNREKMMSGIIRNASNLQGGVFEIGANSDLVLENTVTGNLEWTITEFAKSMHGTLTLPTKFCMVMPLLSLNHNRKTVIRMSVNPQDIIKSVEFGTSSISDRITAIKLLFEAGYPVGIIIAPIIMVDGWEKKYIELIDILAERLPEKMKDGLIIEMIFMTYSAAHMKINAEAFPNGPFLYDKERMKHYSALKMGYKPDLKAQAEVLLCDHIKTRLPKAKIAYVV